MKRHRDYDRMLNNDFEKRWADFLANVEDPEQYMKGEIKEACREFHRQNINKKGEWVKNDKLDND